MLKSILIKTILFLSIFFIIPNTHAQNDPTLKQTILELDQKFWKVYNSCDTEGFKAFLTEDLEFYHDKGGLTNGSEALIQLVKNNLCNPDNPRIRREAIEGTVKVFPLNNYGAIITGEHRFYLTEKGKKEVLAEIAKFTHVWQLKNNEWRMSRVLSYDHQPAPKNTDKKEISLSKEVLARYVGNYQAPQTGAVTISQKEGLLEIKAGNMQALLSPETETHFFHKQAPLSFEFVADDSNTITKMIVRENGNIVEEAKKL